MKLASHIKGARMLKEKKSVGKMVFWLCGKLLNTTYFKQNPWLRTCKLNITSYLAQTFQIFENFKLMAEVRQELDKLKNPISLLPATI